MDFHWLTKVPDLYSRDESDDRIETEEDVHLIVDYVRRMTVHGEGAGLNKYDTFAI